MIDLTKGKYAIHRESAVRYMEGWITSRLVNTGRAKMNHILNVVDMTADDDEVSIVSSSDDMETGANEESDNESVGEEVSVLCSMSLYVIKWLVYCVYMCMLMRDLVYVNAMFDCPLTVTVIMCH